MKAARFWSGVLLLYGLAMIFMIAGWTLILYFDQQYPSPTYRMSLSNCLLNAARFTPVNGAGPLVLLILPLQDRSVWAMPISGGIIYVIIAGLLSRFGRRWPGWLHVFIGVFWLFAGAIVSMAIIHK
jgi:hypothetical protein